MRRKTLSASNRTRLEDVAREAGVSVTTASLALRGSETGHRISAEVVERVQVCARQLDYAPNHAVRAMQRGKSHILSFFNGFRSRGGDDLFINRLCNALERAAGEKGYDILFNCNFDKTPEALYQHLNGGLVDGVLFFAPRSNDPLLPFLRHSRLPCVLINRDDPEGVLPSIREDMETGVELVAEALWQQNPKRIVLLDYLDDKNRQGRPHVAELRIQGVREALTRRGRVVLDEDMFLYQSEHSDGLLSDLAQQECTLFCWHNRLAYRVLQDCERLGLTLPEPLSLIGYDGVHWPVTSRHLTASVAHDLDELANTALQNLLLLCEGQKVETIQRVPVSLQSGTTFVLPISPERKNS